jgi:hypothetical protein
MIGIARASAEMIEKENPAQKSRVCPIYPYTYEILLNVVIIL